MAALQLHHLPRLALATRPCSAQDPQATTLLALLDVVKSWGLKQSKQGLAPFTFNYNEQQGEITFWNGSVIHLKDLAYYPTGSMPTSTSPHGTTSWMSGKPSSQPSPPTTLICPRPPLSR
jgi:hypothetical protein